VGGQAANNLRLGASATPIRLRNSANRSNL
jgi:hypothetical protein